MQGSISINNLTPRTGKRPEKELDKEVKKIKRACLSVYITQMRVWPGSFRSFV